MQTKSYTNRVHVEPFLTQISDINEYTQIEDFNTKINNLLNEMNNTIGHINRIKVIKRLYEVINKEILHIYPIIQRTISLESATKLLTAIDYQAKDSANKIEKLTVKMNDHKLLFDTHSLLRHVIRKIQPLFSNI
jgi:hypothetical protein